MAQSSYSIKPFADFIHTDPDTLGWICDDEMAVNTLEKSIIGISFRELQDLKDLLNRSSQPHKYNMAYGTPQAFMRDMSVSLGSDSASSVMKKLEQFLEFLPTFIFLTDYWDEPIITVITEREPELFETVTKMTAEEFEHLVQIGVFNQRLMDDVVFKYKILVDGSLSYEGVRKDPGGEIGLFNSVIPFKTYNETSKAIKQAKSYIGWTRTRITEEYFGEAFKTEEFISPEVYDENDYRPGVPVIHPEYGLGTVISNNNKKITIRYLIIGDKISGIEEARQVLRIRGVS